MVSPRLVSGYRLHLRRAVAVSDAPVIRALRLAFRDETEAWQDVERWCRVLSADPTTSRS